MSFELKATRRIIIPAFVLLVSVFAAGAQTRDIQRILRIDPEAGSSGAFLGIRMEDVTAETMSKYKLNSERGVIVKSVEEGSPAKTAKLQENDVIWEYCGIPVISARQLLRLVGETPVGRNVDLVVSRDGKKMNLSAELGMGDSPQWSELRSDDPEEFSNMFRFPGPKGRSYTFSSPPDVDLLRELPGREIRGKQTLGITAMSVTDQLAEYLGVPGKKGVLISAVKTGSPADSKLKAGDVIIKADGNIIGSTEELSRIVRQKGQGKLDLKVIRDKKEIAVVIDLSAASDGPARM